MKMIVIFIFLKGSLKERITIVLNLYLRMVARSNSEINADD